MPKCYNCGWPMHLCDCEKAEFVSVTRKPSPSVLERSELNDAVSSASNKFTCFCMGDPITVMEIIE